MGLDDLVPGGFKIFDEGDKVRRWRGGLDNPDPALKQIGALMVAESQKAFKAQKFGDESWKPRGVPNVFGIISDFYHGKRKPPNRRFEDRPALRDTGALAKSIAFDVVGNTVTVGSNLPYAGTHNFGGPSESLPITQQVSNLMGDWLLKTTDDSLIEKLGFLLEKKMLGKTLKGEVPARPFVGITKQTMADVHEAVGVEIMEAT